MSGGSLPPAFLAPRSVAVVGASRDPSKVGGSVLANLRAAGFPGRVVPINPRAGSIQGLRALPSVLALEEPVDLAVIAVPAADVLPALEACVARGVAGAIIISAGFREAGLEGQAREAKLRSWLRGQPIRVMGPNCLGWIRPRAASTQPSPPACRSGAASGSYPTPVLSPPPSSTGPAIARWASPSSRVWATRRISPKRMCWKRRPRMPRRA